MTKQDLTYRLRFPAQTSSTGCANVCVGRHPQGRYVARRIHRISSDQAGLVTGFGRNSGSLCDEFPSALASNHSH